jgi:hypothetical protein
MKTYTRANLYKEISKRDRRIKELERLTSPQAKAVVRAAIRSYKWSLANKYGGNVSYMLAGSYTATGRALIRTCERALKAKKPTAR